MPPSKKQSKRQTKASQSAPMHKHQDTENRSCVHVPDAHDVSDSENDKPVPSQEARKKPVAKGLFFGNSPVKCQALAIMQAKGIHKNLYDTKLHQKQRSSSVDHSAKLRLDYASHQSAVSLDM